MVATKEKEKVEDKDSHHHDKLNNLNSIDSNHKEKGKKEDGNKKNKNNNNNKNNSKNNNNNKKKNDFIIPNENHKENVSNEKNDFLIDVIIVVIFTILGFYSRFYTIDHPPEVAFDEQHFGKFTNWYIKGEYYLDIHPPLGKLLFTAWSYIIGYDGNIDFDDTTSQYPDPAYISLRSLPAFCGSLFVPLFYLTLRSMNLSPAASSLGGWMILCENIILTETKHILTDGFLFFFDLLAVFCSFTANNRKPLSLSWIIWMLATGIAMGAAVCVKFTALGVVAAIGMHQIFILFKLHNRDYLTIVYDYILRGSLLLLPIFIIFIINFVIHLLILPYTGDGDGFMTAEFRARLITPEGYVQEEYAAFEPLGLFASIKELVKTMHDVNIALKATHPFQSWWNEWPLIQCRALLFWQRLRDGYGMWSYCVGNPFNWLASAVLGVMGFFLLILFGSYSIVSIAIANSVNHWKNSSNRWNVCLFASLSKYWWAGLTVFIGYFANFLPYSLIPRATWNYHYIPALMFAILTFSVVVEIFLETSRRYNAPTHVFVKFISVLFFAGSTFAFLYMAPWTYSIPMSNQENEDRFVFESWRA